MKKSISIVTNIEVVQAKELMTVYLPKKPAFYSSLDVINGKTLFAIIPKIKGENSKYRIALIHKNNQLYSDFHPEEDCSSERWPSDLNIRHTALEILKGSSFWDSISEDDFHRERAKLLSSEIFKPFELNEQKS